MRGPGYTAWRKAYSQRPERKAAEVARARRLRRNPVERMKLEARWQAKAALEGGRLEKGPCSNCGETKVEMHHADYFRPLEITWLCERCHLALHATERRQRIIAAAREG
jgi:ribosomal protein S27AE